MIKHEHFAYIDDAVIGTVGAMESDKAVGEIYHIEIKMKLAWKR